ncbi:MAG: hypothetical protein LQ338_001500 [Usnochroma carphineum]|nr:MAG: hypothetical protein LQ338_001500 [Usnochroma carphineum]
MFSKVSLVFAVVFFGFPPSSLAANGTLDVFLDGNCDKASIINPTVDLPANTCLVTPGAHGIAVELLPPCASGTATLVEYSDHSCVSAEADDVVNYNNCYAYGVEDIPAVQFVCKGSVATSTITMTFGSSTIPVAAGTAAPVPGGGSGTTSPPSNEAAPTTHPSSSAPSSHTDSGVGGDGSSSGLSHNAQIALGVGVPVAALIVAFLAWQFPKRMRRHEEPEQYNMETLPTLPKPASPPYHATWNLHINNSQTQPDNRNYGYHQQSSASLPPYSPGGRSH